MFDERAMPGAPTWAEMAAPHLARYALAAEYARGRCVLDAGSGAGYGAAILAEGGASRVVGVDLDDNAVGRARDRFGGPTVEFLADDCQQLSRAGGPFDVICSFENIEHLPQPELFLEAAARLLTPEGLLIVSTPDRTATPAFVDGRPRNPFHLHEWYREEFAALLAPRFEEVDMRAQIESLAVVRRSEAVEALRGGLMWANPVLTFLWRKLSRGPGGRRSWRLLDGLAAGSPGDYPIVSLKMAGLLGRPWCHVAICRRPVRR